jgi:hypothetical protein
MTKELGSVRDLSKNLLEEAKLGIGSWWTMSGSLHQEETWEGSLSIWAHQDSARVSISVTSPVTSMSLLHAQLLFAWWNLNCVNERTAHKPIWTDPSNQNGRHLILRCPRHEASNCCPSGWIALWTFLSNLYHVKIWELVTNVY